MDREGLVRALANLDSYHGPALLVTAADAAGFVGRIGFGARAAGVVELDYGIAPRWRGRGFATRATMLATEMAVARSWRSAGRATDCW